MKKSIALVMMAVLLVAASVMGTLAYLTSTDTVKNTFTVGKVAITLDEAKVDENGKVIADAERVKENSYKLMPGHKYTKDPTVTVKAGSEESYVRQIVTVSFNKELNDAQLATNLDSIFQGYNASEWVRNAKDVKNENGKTVITYEYRYKETVTATDGDTKLPALFTGIKIPENWTKEILEGFGEFEINIVAHAIQADGFTTADAAWAKFIN